MLHLLFLQAISDPGEFHPPIHLKSTGSLKKALQKAYVSREVMELTAGDCRVTFATGQRTSGLTVLDVFVYAPYRPRGVRTGTQILAAYLYGRSGHPRPRLVKVNGDYSLLLEYVLGPKKKIRERISLSLFHSIYRPY